MAIQQNMIDKLVPGLGAADHRQHYLQAIVQEYPFYAAAQLAFVKEHSPNDLSIEVAKQRAALVWHPLVLEQYLLKPKDSTKEEDDDGPPEIPSMKAIPLSEIEDEETTLEPMIELDNHSSVGTESGGSVMDIVAVYDENQTILKEEEELSAWAEREKLESSLADEMNETADRKEQVTEAEAKSLHGLPHSQEILEVEKQEEQTSSTIDINEQGTFIATASTDESVNNIKESQSDAADVKEKDEMLFEPLHTSDYFASQGIKLTEEKIPTDKLGKQLKSFTEWLQTMKSVHPTNIDLKINLNQDVAVLAEKSNVEKEVITESMAIAYIAQGKPQKAADIYEKLKLIYPHKSAYFAAELMKL